MTESLFIICFVTIALSLRRKPSEAVRRSQSLQKLYFQCGDAYSVTNDADKNLPLRSAFINFVQNTIMNGFYEGWHTYYVYIITIKPAAFFMPGLPIIFTSDWNSTCPNTTPKVSLQGTTSVIYCILKSLPGFNRLLSAKRKLKT